MTIDLTMTTGACPVQIEGTVERDGVTYELDFRSRGEAWSCDIAATVDDAVSGAEVVWSHGASYGMLPYDAGWMPHDEAAALAQRCAEMFQRGEAWPDEYYDHSWLVAQMVDFHTVRAVGEVFKHPYIDADYTVVEHWRGEPWPDEVVDETSPRGLYYKATRIEGSKA